MNNTDLITRLSKTTSVASLTLFCLLAASAFAISPVFLPEATEIPELRTWQRFATDDSTHVYPQPSNFWTGRVRFDGNKWTYNLGIIPNPDFRSWAKFDLSSIPDTSTVTRAVLRYCTFPGFGEAFGLWRHLTNDPVITAGPILYSECGSATVVTDTAYEPVSGFMTRTLNSAGLNAIESGLSLDWVAFGWQRINSNGRRYARGYESPEEQPRLTVFYTPPVAIQEPRPSRAGTRLTIAPNPTAARQATLRYSLPSAGPAKLTIYDISGQRVLTQTYATQRNGSLSLNLRNLTAGVYLVRLESDTFTATQKLVVQR